MADEILSEFDDSDLYGELPVSVRTAVRNLEASGADWNHVGAILALSPASGVSLKGGGNWKSDLWQAVKAEFGEFLCQGSPKYEDLRGEWAGLRDKSKHLAVASLSGAIGGHLGVAAGVVAPMVVWLLIVGLRLGKESLCRVINSQALQDQQ